ncbi:MAG: hypothetical protein NTV06_09745, partial [candidate division Zixibacteria bacterium]|nr:hypothetical protein [candidate division Zixibacteria bacterium]
LADDQLVDFFIKLPARLKQSRLILREYFKMKAPELAQIPYQATGVDLYSQPSKIKARLRTYFNKTNYYVERLSGGRLKYYNKTHYHHFNQWYRSDKRNSKFYHEILLDDRTIKRGYFSEKTVRLMLEKQGKGSNLISGLSSLLSFELFNRLFVD